MNSEESSGEATDWLQETLRSAVHHARRDRSEETLMRLAQDPLLLNVHLQGDGSRSGPPASLTGHAMLPLQPASAALDHSATPTRLKLDSYMEARLNSENSIFPEAFVAGSDDKRLALDLGEGRPQPGQRQSFHKPVLVGAAAVGVFFLILVLALAAII